MPKGGTPLATVFTVDGHLEHELTAGQAAELVAAVDASLQSMPADDGHPQARQRLTDLRTAIIAFAHAPSQRTAEALVRARRLVAQAASVSMQRRVSRPVSFTAPARSV